LALKFIFDTGASDVSISSAEAVFMLKHGYLNADDLGGSEYYRIANGDIAEGTKVVLRKIEIGDKTLYNVEASIVHSIDAPLLLGQSVMERLGQFTFDSATNSLIIGKQSGVTKTELGPSMPRDYPSVKIGKQVWMSENLNVERFRNGDLIPNAQTTEEWERAGKLEQPAWCYYENDPKNGGKYGKLYNWYAVMDSRGICPVGWHLPNDNEHEWFILINYLGGFDFASKKMKSESGWKDEGNGNNISGFNGKPGGNRSELGYFRGLESWGEWWEFNSDDENAWYRYLNSDDNVKPYQTSTNKSYGHSVRCIKD
jgi:uncharacterized protein (TIGR02145 family)